MITDEPEESLPGEDKTAVPADDETAFTAAGGADGQPVGGKIPGAG